MELSLPPNVLTHLMPNSESFARSVAALREYFSLAFYRMRVIL